MSDPRLSCVLKLGLVEYFDSIVKDTTDKRRKSSLHPPHRVYNGHSGRLCVGWTGFQYVPTVERGFGMEGGDRGPGCVLDPVHLKTTGVGRAGGHPSTVSSHDVGGGSLPWEIPKEEYQVSGWTNSKTPSVLGETSRRFLERQSLFSWILV